MPTQISFTATVIPVTANGVPDGQIEFSIIDGTAPYDLTLMQGQTIINESTGIAAMNGQTPNKIITGLAPGFYTVSIHDSAVVPSTTENVAALEVISEPYKKLKGSYNPNGLSTVATFEFGETISYGTSFEVDTDTGVASIDVELDLTAGAYNQFSILEPAHTYHYRLKAVNSAGTSYGVDKTFTTPGTKPTVVTYEAAEYMSQE